MTNVTVNGLTAVHSGSNGILTTSDTCLIPPYCVPYPFTNIAKSQDAAMTATSVTINGNPACIQTSNFAVSNGDTPGACGGIVSGTVNGMAEFITFSNNVFIEGIPVVRQTDKMVSNNKNTSPMPLQQPGAQKAPDVSDEGPKELVEAELPYEVDIHVVGDELKSLKSIIGVVDLDLAPEEEEGEAATLEPNKLNAQQESATKTKPTPITKPLTRKLLVKAVNGASKADVGDSLIYKVSKTNLSDPTSEELQNVSWQIKSDDGKVLYEYKNHGPKLELEVDDTLEGKSFKVMPYINSPTPSVSVATKINGDNSYLFPLSIEPTKNYKTGERAFGTWRGNRTRKHGGVDLYGPAGTPVRAMKDGTILRYANFYLGTHALVIDHGDVTIRYGEVSPSGMAPGLKVGSEVKKGQVIAYIGILQLKPPRSMLHIEMYKGTESGRLTPYPKSNIYNIYCRRADIFDPTSTLDGAKRD
jgi:murein DD-endopeptidase MepM/ murein hydrolase activator NlpD